MVFSATAPQQQDKLQPRSSPINSPQSTRGRLNASNINLLRGNSKVNVHALNANGANGGTPRGRWSTAVCFYVAILMMTIVVLLQLNQQTQLPNSNDDGHQRAIVPEHMVHYTPRSNKQQQQQLPAASAAASLAAKDASSITVSNTAASAWDPQHNPLGIPPGQAVNLPAIRKIKKDINGNIEIIDDNDKLVEAKRDLYGGKGDGKHLGGFTALDLAGVSPSVWKHMMLDYGVKSVLDVGCGRGISTSWFAAHGVRVQCVEGSHDAAERTLLPDPANQLVEHDFSRGPWWPAATYDAVWAVQFSEHVNLQYHINYITAFRKAALIFVSTSRWGGGWHHVEVHSDEWWIRKYELYGLKYDAALTEQVRAWANDESKNATAIAPNGERYNAQHVWLTMKVFTNPVVAALPQHAHLFPEFGCYGGRANGEVQHRECGTGPDGALETPLDKSLYPLPITPAMDEEWERLLRKDLEISSAAVKAKASFAAVTIRPETASRPTTSASSRFTPTRPSTGSSTSTKKLPPPPPTNAKNPSKRTVDTADTEFTIAQAAIRIDEAVLSVWREGYKKYPNPVTLTNATDDSTNLPIIPVVMWPYLEFGMMTAESQHIEENGVNESRFLELAKDMTNFDPNVVWVGDTGYAYGWNPWCGEYLKRIQMARTKRKELGLPLSWPIYIVDFTDGVTRQRCKNIERVMGKEYVNYSQRSLARKRHWDFAKKWVDVGFRIPLDHEDATYQHSPLVVRTDTIEALQEVLTQRKSNLAAPLEKLERHLDVVHFWPVNWNGVSNVSSILRTQVSRVVTELAEKENLNAFVGLKGSAVKTGRRGVKLEYIEALLDSKIVVVTQRDDWEDHYRLFEAVMSGALVLTDRMLGIPDGLVNGTSIIEFATEEDLKQKILYYLAHKDERVAIAGRGREVAMTRHRTWHRIEDVIFGRIMSECSPDKPGSPCPWIVHANEARRRR
jgi:hypothetical protein